MTVSLIMTEQTIESIKNLADDDFLVTYMANGAGVENAQFPAESIKALVTRLEQAEGEVERYREFIESAELIHFRRSGNPMAIYKVDDTFTLFGNGIDSKGHTQVWDAFAGECCGDEHREAMIQTAKDFFGMYPAATEPIRIEQIMADFALEMLKKHGTGEAGRVADGVRLIADERQRQIDVEGWTAEHDAQYQVNELSRAAVQYAIIGKELLYTHHWNTVRGPEYYRKRYKGEILTEALKSCEEDDIDLLKTILGRDENGNVNLPAHGAWPWDASWWKPSADPIRNLVKAGALIAAEIDRLQRLTSKPASEAAAGKSEPISECPRCSLIGQTNSLPCPIHD